MPDTIRHDEIYLFRKRDIHSGRMGVFWKIFRSEKLTGRIVMDGLQWSGVLKIVSGKLAENGLALYTNDTRVTGITALEQLKEKWKNETGISFSVIVSLKN